MNNKINFLSVALIAFAIGLSTNNFAMSGVPANFNVAIVDIQQLVSSSANVNALKEKQKKGQQDLVNFAKNAREDVAKVKDETKKKALEDKYNKQLNDMKNAMDEGYRKDLKEIDNNMTKVIQEQAKSKNYDLVLSKSIVLFGGTDITAEISKAVK